MAQIPDPDEPTVLQINEGIVRNSVDLCNPLFGQVRDFIKMIRSDDTPDETLEKASKSILNRINACEKQFEECEYTL
jgi:DNA-directed RNA polymerase subunit L